MGKDIDVINSQYKVGLQKQDYGYRNSDAYHCDLRVDVDSRNRITEIQITPNTDQCNYNAISSGVSFNAKTTNTVDILNQAKLENIEFIPGCFNCPSRIELTDSLIVNRAEDRYYTSFEIEGYNRDYHNFMVEKLFGNFNQGNYYPMMDKLDETLTNNPSYYQRKDFKIKAIQTYNLKQKPWSYSIVLK